MKRSIVPILLSGSIFPKFEMYRVINSAPLKCWSSGFGAGLSWRLHFELRLVSVLFFFFFFLFVFALPHSFGRNLYLKAKCRSL